jgi:hypothetical protein
VFSGDVIGIFDYKLTSISSFREFIDASEWKDQIFSIEGLTKSVVVTLDRIYFTPVSRATLVRRWKRYSKPFTSFGAFGV